VAVVVLQALATACRPSALVKQEQGFPAWALAESRVVVVVVVMPSTPFSTGAAMAAEARVLRSELQPALAAFPAAAA
jgi:hypothetical protein